MTQNNIAYDQQKCGERLGQELRKRKIQYKEIAEIFDISKQTMTAYVSGKNAIPTNILAQIVIIINKTTPDDQITADYLMFGIKFPQLKNFTHKAAREDLKILKNMAQQLNQQIEKLQLDLFELNKTNNPESIINDEVKKLKYISRHLDDQNIEDKLDDDYQIAENTKEILIALMKILHIKK